MNPLTIEPLEVPTRDELEAMAHADILAAYVDSHERIALLTHVHGADLTTEANRLAALRMELARRMRELA